MRDIYSSKKSFLASSYSLPLMIEYITRSSPRAYYLRNNLYQGHIQRTLRQRLAKERYIGKLSILHVPRLRGQIISNKINRLTP